MATSDFSPPVGGGQGAASLAPQTSSGALQAEFAQLGTLFAQLMQAVQGGGHGSGQSAAPAGGSGQAQANPAQPAANAPSGGQPQSGGAAAPQPPGATDPASGPGAPAQAQQPANSINAKDFGVKGDGTTDDTAGLQKAFDAAKAQGKSVFLGAGTYAHSGTLKADGVGVSGAGDKTVLKATNQDSSAIKLTGNGASLSNLKVDDSASKRSSMPDAAGVLVQGATGASVSHVTVDGAGSNGVRLDGASDSQVSNSLVAGSNADGIALMNGSSGNKISGNQVSQAGDDSFSDDSYKSDAKQDTGNSFSGNLAQDNAYGRGFALMGSANDTLANNVSNGTPGNGIVAGTDANSGTQAGSGDTIKGNLALGAKDTPISAGGMAQADNKTSGSGADIASTLGWTPAAGVPDRATISPGYTPGTGNGANNSGGARS